MNKGKKLILALITILSLAAFNTDVFAGEWYPTPTPTPTPRTQPRITLAGPVFVEVVGGETKDVTIPIKNVGNTWANNVFTNAKIETENAPFTLEFIDRTNYTATMSWGNTKDIKMRIVVDKDAAAGNYNVTLSHSFLNDQDEIKTETDTIYIKIDNAGASTRANIIMDSFKSSSDNISAGDTFSVTARVENVGAQSASDVQILLEGLKTDEIYIANSTNSAVFKVLEGGKRDNVTYQLAASDKIKQGSYPIVFKVKFKDKDNEDYEKEYYYYVNVGGSAKENKASVQVTNLTGPSVTYGVGDEFKVEMELTNIGHEEAENIKISAVTDGDGAIVPRSSSIQTVASLIPEQKKALAFSFAPTSKSKTQNYAIGFTVTYETGEIGDDNKPVTISYDQYIGVNVSNPDAEEDEKTDEKTSIPKIIVSQYTCDPIMVKAGQEFDLSMTFQNTHSTKSIENIRAYLTVAATAATASEDRGSVFTPVNSSNTFYIDRIAPKGEVRQQLRMYAIPDAKPRTYTIEVNFEYQDQDFNKYEATELIGINVKQYTKLETSEINLPTEGFVGQPINLSFDFYNTGKADLFNLIMKVEGNFDTTASTAYYGKFTIGNSNYYDGSFMPLEPGPQEGKLIMSFEDDAGEKTEIEKEFTVNVMEMSMPDFSMDEMQGRPGMMEDGMGGGAMGIVKNPYVWVGVVAAGAVIFFGARKFKKKRKDMDLDE